jgi:hypothetical protein
MGRSITDRYPLLGAHVCAAALVLPDIFVKQELSVLINLIAPRNFVYDGDLGPTEIAGEFKLVLSFDLICREIAFLAASRARDIDAVRRHFEVSSRS